METHARSALVKKEVYVDAKRRFVEVKCYCYRFLLGEKKLQDAQINLGFSIDDDRLFAMLVFGLLSSVCYITEIIAA